jgi:hypothetical protein
MCHIQILLFLLILCAVLYLSSCITIPNSFISTVQKNIYGGFDPKGFTFNNKHVNKPLLIVDVANLHTEWYKQNFKKPLHYFNQQILFNYYLKAMKNHNDIYNDKYVCHYVIKNFRLVGKSTKAINISPKDLKMFQKFCSDNKCFISLAQDYTGVKKSIWDKNRYHYVRERDDYLCLWLAKMYKLSYMKVTIMTNDKFKDFNQFGFIPEFTATHINNNKIISRKIKPKPNYLGQLRDYKIIPIKI